MATVHAVTVKDHICYAAVANFGACQIDVSDPTNPQLIGYLPMNSTFLEEALLGCLFIPTCLLG